MDLDDRGPATHDQAVAVMEQQQRAQAPPTVRRLLLTAVAMEKAGNANMARLSRLLAHSMQERAASVATPSPTVAVAASPPAASGATTVAAGAAGAAGEEAGDARARLSA
ncbi:unnamed protein product, partial [Closterium sp. Yama58-4]